jgi:hypothetical protein
MKIFFAAMLCLALSANATTFGTIAAGDSTTRVMETMGGDTSVCNVTLSGTWTGTAAWEFGTIDVQGAWTWTSMVMYGEGAVASTRVVNAGANGTWIASMPGVDACAVRFSTPTTGILQVKINTTKAPMWPALFPVMVGNTSGTSMGGTATNMGLAAPGNTSLMVALIGKKSVVHQPSVATAASASIAAGGAGVRHVAESCQVSISTVAAQAEIIVNLRDGATGAGTVLWSCRMACAITSRCVCETPSPTALVGTAATAMTCETATAAGASNFATANLFYHDAS